MINIGKITMNRSVLSCKDSVRAGRSVLPPRECGVLHEGWSSTLLGPHPHGGFLAMSSLEAAIR